MVEPVTVRSRYAARPVSVLDLREVSVSYDSLQSWALDRLDWTVKAEQRWVVLGPNGSGKTTLVQLVTGYLHPTRGDLELLGAHLGSGVDWRLHRQRVSVVSAAFAKQIRPALPAVDVVMTARFGALEPWWHTYEPADAARARDLLETAGFGYVADRPFGVLSEGERQQVQLARSRMRHPELVVLDEPAAGLDLGARERLVAQLRSFADDPSVTAIVLVTHHVEEVPPGFTHALLLRDGRAVAAGPIEEVITSRLVSEAFGLRVDISFAQDRFAARATL